MDDLKLGCIGVLLIGALLFLAGGCVCVVNATDCSALQQQTGHQTQWVFWGGGKENCLILIDGQWVPTSSWIVNSGN